MKSFKTFLIETMDDSPKSGKVYRLDSDKIENFEPQPYGIAKDGSSQRGLKKESAKFKLFDAIYAAKTIEQIAPYAMVGKDGKTSEVPWVAVYPKGKKATLYILEKDFNSKHPPIYISEFDKKQFTARKNITRRMWGKKSTDTGDDEYISMKSQKPENIDKIENIQEFIKKHMNVKFVDSTKDFKDIVEKFKGIEGDIIQNGSNQ